MSLLLRLAQTDDLAAIRQLEQECEDTPHWSEEIWRDLLRQTPLRRVCFLAVDRELQGFAVVACVDAITELESIVVRPAARRQGIGRSLCVEMIAWAQQHGAEAMQLEVRATNAKALALYRRLGFLEQGRRAAYYRNPVEDAVLMRLQINRNTAKV